jgi:hypothetical protein
MLADLPDPTIYLSTGPLPPKPKPDGTTTAMAVKHK